MIVQKILAVLLHALIISLLITSVPNLTWAQNVRTAEMNARTEPYHRTARIHVVKRDQIAAWESLMKERRVAEEAAGRIGRHVFQRMYGETSTFLILLTYAENPPEIDLSPTWGTRLASTIDSASLMLIEMYREHEVNLERWLTKSTDLLYVRLRTTAAGRTQDYHDWQTEKLYPMLKEGGETVRGGRLVLGGNTRTWVRFAIVDSFSSLGEPNPVLESRQFQRMYAEGEEMIVNSVDYLYQYRADLSFRRSRTIQ
jgi:hypothetical protein